VRGAEEEIAVEENGKTAHAGATQTAGDWVGDLGSQLGDYEYQPELTSALDAWGGRPFDQELVNEIVLWKVNRYVRAGPDVLGALDGLTHLRKRQHREAREPLLLLLRQRGVDLPMASTLLRFRNPEAFQIVDRHAYRAVYGQPYPLYVSSKAEDKVRLYFDYLDAVIDLAQMKDLDFRSMDRILYVFDKAVNGPLNDATARDREG
jgi:hypothetical protein